MALDQFEVRVDLSGYIQLRVNRTGLIDLVREVELPYAQLEFDTRIAAGAAPDEIGQRGSLAGDYLYPDSDHIFLPSRNLLGAAYQHGFRTAPDDPRNRKSLLLQCTCGIADCWFLLATITVRDITVEWSDFCQFHRDWRYDIGPLIFDRASYESQLVKR
jgi:hypothetical protein